MSATVSMDGLVNLCKSRGFVFPGSDIYGGMANTWDYGPLGVELKNNIQKEWWRFFVQQRQEMVGIDAAIIMNPKVWQASGHVDSFNDAQVDCLSCKRRYRADHLIENALNNIKVEGLSPAELDDLIAKNGIKCPDCGQKSFTSTRVFNLLFQTNVGPLASDSEKVYLRGELAQSMFTNFKNVLNSSRKKVPFGIAQVGKCFRNEITPGNFIFRTLEFDLMEFEYFVHPLNWRSVFDYWLDEMRKWLDICGIDCSRTRVREHSPEELSHYSQRTVDIEFETPFGWKELYGLAYRTDFDLRNHQEKSGKDLSYLDPYTNERYIPHVIEPTFGLSRSVLMTLISAYNEEKTDGETRVVLKLKPKIAPFKIAVLPLVNKLENQALSVFDVLKTDFNCDFDSSGSIGKRYRRQDEIGTPLCLTYDFDSVEDKMVTIRDRDTMDQARVPIANIAAYVQEHLEK